ncbi:MAG TPA: hypothetical protein PJ988_15550, partial [Anaerolinea sp.]|nr:hypothetical protein [Anaerolinea sp.]
LRRRRTGAQEAQAEQQESEADAMGEKRHAWIVRPCGQVWQARGFTQAPGLQLDRKFTKIILKR